MPWRQRVLLVDDDHEILEAARLRLRAAGYETCEAHDGTEGVEAAHRSHPDAIVMDIKMPHMDGLQALGELRRCVDTERIPVVMLSASLIDRQKALDAGARFFLTKPYQGKALVDAVQTALVEAGALP
jgi:DNA-binding response OmpR family regulator